MTGYKLLIKMYEDGKEVFKAVQPTNGQPYIFKTESEVKQAYYKLYGNVTFRDFNSSAKVEPVEVPENFNFTVY